MSVTIRLARVGKRNAPTYKIVASNTRDKRNGRFLEVLGHHNPTVTPPDYKIDEKLFEKLVKDGALVSDAVKKIREGNYTYEKYEPKKAGAAEADASTEPAEPTATEEASQTEETVE